MKSSKNVTLLDNLNVKRNSYSIKDDDKFYTITMIDHNTGQPLGQKVKCFWCKNFFTGKAIGCPISYQSKTIQKEFQSCVTKEYYKLVEPVTDKRYNENIDKKDCQVDDKECYIVDGCFCSGECVLAWIDDNSHNPLYYHSKYLLINMFTKIDPSIVEHIKPAPSWRLLEDFGGPITIEQFRNFNNETKYIATQMLLTKVPRTRPLGVVYEEQSIF
jgi:hypothetical protein